MRSLYIWRGGGRRYTIPLPSFSFIRRRRRRRSFLLYWAKRGVGERASGASLMLMEPDGFIHIEPFFLFDDGDVIDLALSFKGKYVREEESTWRTREKNLISALYTE